MKVNQLSYDARDIKEFFKENSEVAVAFSGGVDSAVLLMLASKYAKRVKAYYVKSQFQPQFELDDAIQISKILCTEMEIINADILSCNTVAENPQNRCYYCKKEIFGKITAQAKSDGFKIILDGTNASDDISDRPGFKALQELKVLSPLKTFGLTKEQIRQIARQNDLPVADKPSYACLATRIPTGTLITEDMLKTTESAENVLRNMGFLNFRIRFSGGDAKIELGKNDFKLFCDVKDKIYSALSKYYNNVYLSLKERADE